MTSNAVLLPLASALAFPLAAMSLQRAMRKDDRPYGALFICNLGAGLVFLPFFLRGPDFPGWSLIWQPAIAGILFLIGQWAAFKSFQGEISIAIPVQGTKVLFVAFLAALLLGQEVEPLVWMAAVLSVIAIYLLREQGDSPGANRRQKAWTTLAYAGTASMSFAGLDVWIQQSSASWGDGFAPWAFLVQALLSPLFLLMPGRPHLRFSAAAWRWLLGGALGMALITFGLVFAINRSGNATQVNLLFNTRCVWGVALVWLAGRWFGNQEAKSTRRILTHRLEGACLMMVAIVMALYSAEG